MKKKYLIIIALSVFCLSFKVEDPLSKLLKQLAKLTEKYPQEKVHIHTDKDMYAIGEDIWLKAYVVMPNRNIPSPLSRVLYVDLINNETSVKRITLQLDTGLAAGNISIPDSLQPGNYRIRAYTNYMRNFPAQFFFEKQIRIGSVVDTVANARKEVDQKFTVQFFPEGGALLEQVRSRVGIKAVSADGYGVNLSGYISDSKKNKVAVFETTHYGMGVFALLPQTDEKYTAVVTLADGTVRNFELPRAQKTGYAIAAFQDSTQITIKVSANQNLKDSVYIVGQTNGSVYAVFSGAFTKNIMTTSFPKKNFPTGIAQFTLFNKSLLPVAERVVFVNNRDLPDIEIKRTGAASTKKKTNFDIVVKDAEGYPIKGNFSVAVTNNDIVQKKEDEQVSILSNLLLSSDLKGYIENPNHYFNTENADREKNLDHLMLTQGWTRFSWNDVIQEREPVITYPIEQGIGIYGKVEMDYKPLANAKISLLPITKGLLVKLDTVSNAKGEFSFDNMDLADSASFMVQSKTKKDFTGVRISMQQPPAVQKTAIQKSTIDFNSYIAATRKHYDELNRYQLLGDGILLKPVEIKTKLMKSILNIPGSTNVSGGANYVVKREQLEKEINVMSSFYKIPGLFTQDGKIYALKRTSFTTQSPMLLIVDGVQVNQDSNPTYLPTLNVMDLEGIEVLTSGYHTAIYGIDGNAGVIVITSKRGSNLATKSTNFAKLLHIGFHTPKQFYLPDYDDPKQNTGMKDLRTTVYWNPTLKTNDTGEAKISFFNTDITGNYKLVIEGIDIDGNLARKVMTYEVK